jgi:hypothetical protein
VRKSLKFLEYLGKKAPEGYASGDLVRRGQTPCVSRLFFEKEIKNKAVGSADGLALFKDDRAFSEISRGWCR